jgi:CubicO group peptidase (beta-lactamase class C family)
MMLKRKQGFLLIPLAVLILPLTGQASESGSPAAKPEVAAVIDVFDAWAEYRATRREQPGVSIGLVYDQELIWAKSYGYADLVNKTTATPSTAYRIASLSKVFTATAILQLRDTGLLQLDDPVAKHLDWFRLQDKHPDSSVITIRHLLTHTSGLPRELDALYWDEMDFPDREAFVKMLQEASTILPRETKFKYSNVAFGVLGLLVEAVSEQNYSDYVTENIFAPLGMTASRVLPPKDMPALATGYKYRKPGKPRIEEPFTDLAAMVSAGNLASTVEDLAKFLALQFREGPAGGAQILKGPTLREMQRVHWLDPEWEGGRGLGWGILRLNGRTLIGHGGYVPGHTTTITADPKEKFAVIVLTNAGDGEPFSYARQAWSIVAPAVIKAMAEAEKPPVADESWVQYVGLYEWDDGAVSRVMLLNGELALVDPASDTPWESRVRLEPVSDGVFKMKDPTQEGELVRFELDADGKVTRMVLPGYSLQKAD